jgi:hypothetical protein
MFWGKMKDILVTINKSETVRSVETLNNTRDHTSIIRLYKYTVVVRL